MYSIYLKKIKRSDSTIRQSTFVIRHSNAVSQESLDTYATGPLRKIIGEDAIRFSNF